ncbi:hypothetical protein SteCoe_16966 [Stentor coeruleus]|uniref:Tyrosine-protein kinase ephrin type A/B receptor-like domain-containing protein n=1 Tax=Stentor coeruleus TaxID=5963 RepID=A0A1R2C0A6_9CILI|nr:hypothetical protein SteCoe_16966 [Stentor coeruleus]
MLICFLKISLAYEISKIPSYGSPPSRLTGATAVYDEVENRIITFGGFDYQLNQASSEIKTFDLTSLEWGILTSHSNIVPPGLDFACMYLRDDRKLFVFFGMSSIGNNNEVYSYNINTYTFKIEKIKGFNMLGRTLYAFTSFSYNNTNYVGIFGGIMITGLDYNLYLINMETLEARKMPYNDQGPWIRVGTTLTYYNNTLYMYGYVRKDLAPNDDLTGIYAYSLIEEKWTLIPTGDGPTPEIRFDHFAYLYNDEMFIIFGLRIDVYCIYDDIWKFNFVNQKWTLIADNIKDFRAQSANVIIGSKVYLLYGDKGGIVFNSILTIDIAYDIPIIEYVSINMLMPLKRAHHCSFVIGDYMYIFGGLYSYKSYLNDMWRYHFITESWEPITAIGDVPSARAHSACVQHSGNKFAMFGGTDGINAFNDLYFYHENYNTWIKAQVLGDKPSGRWSSCICYSNYKYFIIDGQNFQQAFNDIWVYSYNDEKYTLIKSDFNIYSITKHNCWLTTDTDSVKINIVGGSTFEFFPNSFWFMIQISSDLHTEVSVLLYSQDIFYSETKIVVSNNKMYMFFGSTWNKISVSYLNVLDLKTYKVVTNKTDVDEKAIYGHSISHYGNAFYIFGGGISHDTAIIPNIYTNLLYKLKINDGSEFKIPCSDGTVGPECSPCIEGTYFLIDHCEPCPKGTYSPYISAVYIEQCYPCPEGKFAPYKGLSYCLDCPGNTSCPIGTSQPNYLLYELSQSSIQPLIYTGKTNYITNTVLKLWYSLIAFSLLVLFFSIIFKKLWKSLNNVDIFATYHSQDLNVPIIYKKTSIGGLFSLMFIFGAFVSITGSLMNYTLNNITEIKALVPVLTLEEDIIAHSVIIISTFYMYGGDCVNNHNACIEDISYTIIGLSFSSEFVSCKLAFNNCIISLELKNVRLLLSSASVYIDLKESRSYASFIGINITSSSSIPTEISSIYTITKPPSKDYLFRGLTPTKISFKFTPSVFISESTEWPSFETGFHVSLSDDPVFGSLATQKNIYSQAYLRTLINIEKSDTGMMTQRRLNSTLFMFIGGLLGSVFGLMGIFTAIMVFTEGFTKQIKKNKKKKLVLEDLCENMEMLYYEFNKYKEKRPNKKLRPKCYQVTTNYIESSI